MNASHCWNRGTRSTQRTGFIISEDLIPAPSAVTRLTEQHRAAHTAPSPANLPAGIQHPAVALVWLKGREVGKKRRKTRTPVQVIGFRALCPLPLPSCGSAAARCAASPPPPSRSAPAARAATPRAHCATTATAACCRTAVRKGLAAPCRLPAVMVVSLAGSSVMFYLAAAVSDFYIPASEMSEHKIQSSEGALQITMKMVPKMLSPLVKEWAPEAFVISFKLETDPLILIDKSRQALEKYRHQVVVANILESRRTSVIIVTKDSQTPLTLSEEEIAQGMEIEEKIVSYLQGQHTLFMEKKI
uniref:DNA/pantothenate metabolism flavoprotein C-terminal domain-containing protein n=2 Tax=Meleagris gallopavo TaxID=9103 RepID=G1N5A2_MELGA